MTANRPRVWLIGENNPYGDDPRYAMYPEPERSAGGRMCRLVLGLSPSKYLLLFERRNLLQAPKWSAPAAKAAANAMRAENAGNCDTFILLGKLVTRAFFSEKTDVLEPFKSIIYSSRIGERARTYLSLPHPSGLSRVWNEPGSFLIARAAVARAAPHLAPLLGNAPSRLGDP